MLHRQSMIDFLHAVLSGEDRPMSSAGTRLAAREDGMLTLTVAVVMLGFIIMLGLIGNVGRITREKMEVQNAADAAAYSSALWMARGMNAVTATNHLLGELTAVCVLHEAIGGALLDERGRGEVTGEMSIANGLIYFETSPFKLAWMADGWFVDSVVGEVTSDIRGPTAGATLYDARMQLKRYTVVALAVKAFGQALIFTVIGAGVGGSLHRAGSGLLGKIWAEWKLLDLLERAAVLFKDTKQKIQQTVIPAIAGYGDALARTGLGGVIGPAVNEAIQRTGDANGVSITLYPPPMSLALPIDKEPEPEPTDGSRLPRATYRSRGVLSDIKKILDDALRPAEATFRVLESLFDNAITRFLPSKVRRYFGQASKFFHRLNNELSFSRPEGFEENPSLKDLRDMKVDWSDESRSQWARATYPYVDGFRIPFAEALDNIVTGAPLAKAGTWYMQWTSRFAVAKPVEFRQGKHGRKLAMYVMRDSDRDAKGREPWTSDSREAERHFTVIAFARREVNTFMAPAAFGEPSPRAMVAYSQAICYNANPQQPASNTGRQPTVGWDTLNWDPARPAREFDGYTDPGTSGFKMPWDAFLKWDQSPPVKLNWQAKLVPVTRSRLQEAWPTLPSDFRQPLKTAPLTSPQLDTH